MRRRILCKTLAMSVAVGLVAFGCPDAPGSVETYPQIPNAKASQIYRVTVDGRPVFAEKVKDVNCAQFSFSGKVSVSVQTRGTIKTYNISPRSYGVTAKAQGSTLQFILDRPRQLVITVNDGERLFLFADAIDRDAPLLGRTGVTNVRDFDVDPTGQRLDTALLQRAIDQVAAAHGVLYFPPGAYLTGTLTLKSNLTLYLAGGAVLLGSVRREDYPLEALLARSMIKDDLEPWLTPGTDITDCRLILIDNARNIRIAGRGAIDGQGKLVRAGNIRPHLFHVRSSSNIAFEGVALRDSGLYSIHTLGSDHITCRGLKILNDQTVLNTDGIDPDATQDVLIENCFFLCGDDAISVKTSGHHFLLRASERHIVRNCVFFSTTSAAKLGNETFDDLRDILFENNDILEATRAFTLSTMDGGRFENIRFIGTRVERLTTNSQRIVLLFHVRQRAVRERPGWGRLGWIHNVLVKDFSVEEDCPNPSRIAGFSQEHDVRGIRFENYSIKGRIRLNVADANFQIGPFVSDVSFAEGTMRR